MTENTVGAATPEQDVPRELKVLRDYVRLVENDLERLGQVVDQLIKQVAELTITLRGIRPTRAVCPKCGALMLGRDRCPRCSHVDA